jgi:outer membrane protein
MNQDVSPLSPRRILVRAIGGAALTVALLTSAPGAALAQAGAGIGVDDAGRVFQESAYGLSLLEQLKKVREQKQAEGRTKQADAQALQDRIDQGRLALSPDKIEELQKELEEKVIDLQRFEDDAKREIDLASSEAMNSFNQQIMPLIDSVGRELGFTLIFNKFEAGLLFADEKVDITDAVIARFDERNAASAASSQPSE